MEITKLHIRSEIIDALEKMNYKNLTEIQSQTIPLLLEGHDVIGQAQTGTGKTAAFGIPIINNCDVNNKAIEHLILAPTRELASQITHELRKISSEIDGIEICEVIGGVSYDRQRKELRRNPNIVVGTPGRIIDHLNNHKLDITKIKTYVLDEADEMLNVGFKKELDEIVEFLPENRQTCLFSATINQRIKDIAKKVLTDQVEVLVSTGLSSSSKITQQYVVIKEAQKFRALRKFLDINLDAKVIIFGRSKRRVAELCEALDSYGYGARPIHGDMAQEERTQSMNSLKKGNTNILVATDVAARGIHIDGIDIVFNFDLPQEIEYYVHRIGRSGRGDVEVGRSISFVRKEELTHLDLIREQTSSELVQINIPSSDEAKAGKKEKLVRDIQKVIEADEVKGLTLTEELLEIYDEKTLVSALISLLGSKAVKNKVVLSPEPPVRIKRGGGNRSGGFGGRRNDRNGGNRRRNDSRRRDGGNSDSRRRDGGNSDSRRRDGGGSDSRRRNDSSSDSRNRNNRSDSRRSDSSKRPERKPRSGSRHQ